MLKFLKLFILETLVPLSPACININRRNRSFILWRNAAIVKQCNFYKMFSQSNGPKTVTWRSNDAHLCLTIQTPHHSATTLQLPAVDTHRSIKIIFWGFFFGRSLVFALIPWFFVNFLAIFPWQYLFLDAQCLMSSFSSFYKTLMFYGPNLHWVNSLAVPSLCPPVLFCLYETHDGNTEENNGYVVFKWNIHEKGGGEGGGVTLLAPCTLFYSRATGQIFKRRREWFFPPYQKIFFITVGLLNVDVFATILALRTCEWVCIFPPGKRACRYPGAPMQGSITPVKFIYSLGEKVSRRGLWHEIFDLCAFT